VRACHQERVRNKVAEVDPSCSATRPKVSVAVTAFRRRDLLERAVESVRRQTLQDWELVVSDDEDPPGESWNFLTKLAQEEPRLRPIRNQGRRGALENTNNSLVACRGTWIKLLHDDDVLRPTCLEKMVAAAEHLEKVVLVTCRADYYSDGKLTKRFTRGRLPLIERIDRNEVHLAMYLLEDLGGSLPSQQMIHRSVIDGGCLLEKVEGIQMIMDSCWNTKVRALGETLILNEALTEWHQGAHETITSTVPQSMLDDEFVLFRRYVRGFIPAAAKAPPLDAVEQMVLLTRALHRLRHKRFGQAFDLVRRVKNPRAYLLAVRWVLQQLMPGRFSRVRRYRVLEAWPKQL